MTMIADGLLIAGALAAALYCAILARRLKGLSRLDSGLGGAISALSAQVDEMQISLKAASKASGASMKDLVEITGRAEIAAGRLELLLSALHERGEPAKPVHRKAPQPAKAEVEALEEPLLNAVEQTDDPSSRVDLINALQQVMTAVKK